MQRIELRELQGRVEILTALVAEHGIQTPADDPRLGASGAEHLAQCRRVVRLAYELLMELEALREMVGSGMELLEDSWR